MVINAEHSGANVILRIIGGAYLPKNVEALAENGHPTISSKPWSRARLRWAYRAWPASAPLGAEARRLVACIQCARSAPRRRLRGSRSPTLATLAR